VIFKILYISLVVLLLLSVTFFAYAAESNFHMDEDVLRALPSAFIPEAEADISLCPQGARVIVMFLTAWKNDDYETMYKLLDDNNKKDYTLEQAKFDFQFLTFKEYRISNVKKKESDFEFFLSYGDWRDGNKEVRKMLVNGTTFKIIMLTKNSPFKKSAANF